MSTQKPPARLDYHHGDLRNAVVAVARQALDEGSYETLSLREIARLAGVSANAPYRHFASKNVLLAEVAATGFVALTGRFDAKRHPDPAERLAILGDVYTGFATDNPNLYRLMFGAEKQALMEHPPLNEAAMACFARLVEATIAASGGGRGEDPAILRRANAVWAIVHGWSRLKIDGMTMFQPDEWHAPASEWIRVLVASWSAAPSPRRGKTPKPTVRARIRLLI